MDKNQNFGGSFARKLKGALWQFRNDTDASFVAPEADYVSRLYFPLMNEAGMKCSVTPELKGDIASSFAHYLTPATGTEELHRNMSNRNFWICVEGKQPWSVSGNSALQRANKWTEAKDYSEVEGHLGCFKLIRESKETGIRAESSIFVPATDDLVEVMLVRIKNISDQEMKLTATAATPVFARHPDNFRDHRQVTSMFQKAESRKHGVEVRPTIVHDEKGHSINTTSYFVLGFEADGSAPEDIWSSLNDFIGEGGSLDNPEALSRKLKPAQNQDILASGREAIGAFRFAEKSLKAGETVHYIVLHGIKEKGQNPDHWIKEYGNLQSCKNQLDKTLKHWQEVSGQVLFETADKNFDQWMRWVAFQLKCRQIFGNSFLPDFGYGRGGRGWRDLWQDLLSIFLIDPAGARNEIINNYRGIRIDGSNATIIGNEPGSFVADRNNVARSWCDHGSWPLFVTEFYLHQSGDYDMLLQELPYWKDKFTHRSRKTDELWKEDQGTQQKDEDGNVYQGSILEHILLQQLSAFYNVGEHNNLLLEGADWNDTLDMAREKGESVCFHNFYGYNFGALAEILQQLKEKGTGSIKINEESLILLDSLNPATAIDYQKPEAKQKRLNEYFDQVQHQLSGKKVDVDIDSLIQDLLAKRHHIREHIRENEWISSGENEGFFNGHYDNNAQPVHGFKKDEIIIDLTSQVMPLMCETATKEQAKMAHKAAIKHLGDKESGGLRLCSEFKEIDLNIGRITGFVYGFKEHGSKWMQQNIMFMYGLYKRGMYDEAYDLFKDIYQINTDSAHAKTFPGIPSYFEPGNRGSYAYLTGSSAWMMLTVLTQMFGLRGYHGNLMLKPALHPEFFDQKGLAAVKTAFQGIQLHFSIHNPKRIDPKNITEMNLKINGQEAANQSAEKNCFIVAKSQLEDLCTQNINELELCIN